LLGEHFFPEWQRELGSAVWYILPEDLIHNVWAEITETDGEDAAKCAIEEGYFAFIQRLEGEMKNSEMK